MCALSFSEILRIARLIVVCILNFSRNCWVLNSYNTTKVKLLSKKIFISSSTSCPDMMNSGFNLVAFQILGVIMTSILPFIVLYSPLPKITLKWDDDRMALSVCILYTVSMQLLCSPGHAAVIKSRITLKRIEAAKRIPTALAAQVRHQRTVCLSLPLRGVGERDHLI